MPTPYVVTARRPSMDAREWLQKTSPSVAFGHLEAAGLGLPQRARELIKAAVAADPGSVVLYAVPDTLEQQLLVDELGQAPQPIMAASGYAPSSKICVVEYGSLLVLLRNPGTREKWLQGRLVVLAEVDMYYSAPFALCMLALLASARPDAPKLAGTMRVVTVSLRGPDKSVEAALRMVCPSVGTPWLLHLKGLQQPGHAPSVLRWTGNFSTSVLDCVIDRLVKGKSVMMFCDDDAQEEIQNKLDPNWGVVTVCNDDASLAPAVAALCRRRTSDRMIHPMLLFMKAPSRVPMMMMDLGLVVVASRRRQAQVWDGGHFVTKAVPYSNRELEQAEAYALQSSIIGLEEVTFLAPEAVADPRDEPWRRLEGDQALLFVYVMTTMCDWLPLGSLLACFATDQCLMTETIKMLLDMRCLERTGPGAQRRLKLADAARANLMLQILPAFDYSFRPAWFLSAVAADSTMSEAAKRAMVRMAAIQHVGLDLVTDFTLEQSAAYYRRAIRDVLRYISTSLADACSMPSRLLCQGTLWVALAAWQKGAVMFDNYDGVDETEPDTWDADVTEGDMRGVLIINKIYGGIIGRLVNMLEMGLGLTRPATTRASKLVLSEDCCNRILNVLLETWMHRSVLLLPFRDKTIRVSGVSAETEICLGQDEMLPVRTAMASNRGCRDGLWAVALSLKRTKEGALAASNLLVIPWEKIAAWEAANANADLIKRLRCFYPLE